MALSALADPPTCFKHFQGYNLTLLIITEQGMVLILATNMGILLRAVVKVIGASKT